MGSKLKRLVRARMAETGENYMKALAHVRAQAPKLPAAPPAPPDGVRRMRDRPDDFDAIGEVIEQHPVPSGAPRRG